MNGIRPVRRYLNWRGKQKPLLGLALEAATPVERVSDPNAVRRAWQQQMEVARDAGCDLVLLPAGIGPASQEFADLSVDTARRGLCCVLQPELGAEAFGAAPAGPGLAPGSGLLVIVPIESDGVSESTAPSLHDALRAQDVPLVLTAGDPLGRAGAKLRTCARDCDGTGIRIDDESPSEAASLVAACLAVRLEDRPCLMHVRSADPARILAAGRAALACGSAAVILEIPSGAAPTALKALETLAVLVKELEDELPDPLAEQCATLARLASPHEQRATLGSMLLLQRATATTPALRFEELPSRDAPRLVHVPAHGPLSEAAWTLAWSLAHRGSTVLVTALTLEGDTTLTRLAALKVQTAPVGLDARSAFPSWLRERPVLDTGGIVLSRRLRDGPGRLCLLDRPIELRPTEERALRIVGGLGTEAGLQPEAYLQQGPLDSVRRVLRFRTGVLEADLDAGELRWR